MYGCLRRTPPGVRELKQRKGINIPPDERRTPPGVRELKHKTHTIE